MYEEILKPDKEWDEVYDRENAFGDWSKGRYGWQLMEPIQFKYHYPHKGALSIRDIPEELRWQIESKEERPIKQIYSIDELIEFNK